MKKILRIYVPIGAKASHDLSFWQRIWNPNLASFILKKAKELGVEQALSLNVTAGYLKGKHLSYDLGEVPHKDFPVVLEILDTEQNIKQLLEELTDSLKQCQVFTLNIEERS